MFQLVILNILTYLDKSKNYTMTCNINFTKIIFNIKIKLFFYFLVRALVLLGQDVFCWSDKYKLGMIQTSSILQETFSVGDTMSSYLKNRNLFK